MIKNILFDFDGTIVDTSEGIVKCMHYAFEKLGLELLSDTKVKKVIGPPLGEMFQILLNTDDKEIVDKGVVYFRERYSENGLYELKLYDNVENTLEYLYNTNINMFIVTSKPYEFTKTISENLNIKKYFKYISGVTLSGEFKSKGDRIGEIIDKYNLNLEETLMVGDRQEDVLAANQNTLNSIGILYGFGTRIELESTGCKYFCDTFEELKSIV